MKKKVISVLLITTMLASLLTGCDGIVNKTADKGTEKKEVMVRTGETISADSKWIDSDIEGAIDESTQVNLKDDFYTYVNKDWMLTAEIDDLYGEVGRTLSTSDEIVNDRLLKIFNGEDDPEADGNAEVPEEYVTHDEELVTTFAQAAGDWETRNSEGMEPLKKYVDYIEDIDSLDDLTSYLLDEDSKNLFNINLSEFAVTVMQMDSQNYYLLINDSAPLSLDSASSYKNGGAINIITLTLRLDDMQDKYGYMLERLGYSDKEIKTILKNCYKFECGLVDHMGEDLYYASEWQYQDKSIETSSLEDLKAIEGNYPLTELIEAYGYDTDRMIDVNPSYVKYLGRVLKDSNLEEIKDYLLVHTVKDAGYLLDRECYNKILNLDKEAEKDQDANDISKQLSGNASGDSGDTKDENLSTDIAVQINLVRKYLSGPMDTVYIAKYCKSEEKKDLQDLTEQIVQYYHQMLSTEDWLSDSTLEYANEKLDAMARNILYPDTFVAYDYLDLGDDTELLDMIADINEQSRGSDSYLLDSAPDHHAWYLDQMSTTANNCYYQRQYNSINILAGFTAGDTYDLDMPIEEKLGKIGAVIGHEITHGFDNNGAKYDKDGNYRNWWGVNDLFSFNGRTTTLETYYSGITPYPGASSYSGMTISGEAIADMGGMKCMLGIAKDIEDFDYDLFFTSYEKLWGELVTYDYETSVVKDVHPLNYLRGNVTVMQFDEFYETYDIQPGDGMYLAPDKRISVW